MTSPPGSPDSSPAPDRTAPTPPAGVASVERGHGGEGREDAGQVVRDRHPGPHGWAIGLAGQVEQPAEGDAQAVEAGPRRVRARLPEDADAHVDEVVGQVVGPEAPAFHRAGPEVLAEHVRLGHQPLEELLALGLAQVAGDAAPTASLHRPRQRVARPVVDRDEGAHRAHEVALTRQLDLDDVGPELAEQPGAERRRDPRADVDRRGCPRAGPVPSRSCLRLRPGPRPSRP